MTLLGHIRTRARLIIGPVMAATLFAYFTYHAVQGDRGLLAWIKLGQRVDEARLEHDRISGQRAALENKVRLLQPGHLDADLLEERTRAMLGYVHPDDVVLGLDGQRPSGLSPINAVPVPDPATKRPVEAGLVVRIAY
jgi:cell division protein FtsB